MEVDKVSIEREWAEWKELEDSTEINELSGKTLREYSQEEIFSPLGMHDTFFADNPTELIKNRAYGYVKNKDGIYENNMTNLFWVGDGGLHTTIADMHKWDKHFYMPKLGKDPQAFMKSFMRANSELPTNDSDDNKILYANGQFIETSEYGQKISHSGGWLGASIMYERYPEHQFSSIVMCSNVSADRTISQAISQWYFANMW